MSVFAGYSRYYDLLYRDKDYRGESTYVSALVRQHAPRARSLLEIGCGTGAHAVHLAEMGYDVTGVDSSDGMLDAAEVRRAGLRPDVATRMAFAPGDARTVRLGRTFDAVVSLFHVMSYQTTNEDLAAAFATARAHLATGGVFVFDCWYGPAVLKQWPSVTVREFADRTTMVRRRADPEIHATRNVVDVRYTIDVTDLATRATETLRETHSMRYLFSPEVESALERAGMTLVDSRGWMSDAPPDFATWGACFIARG